MSEQIKRILSKKLDRYLDIIHSKITVPSVRFTVVNARRKFISKDTNRPSGDSKFKFNYTLRENSI